jgi:hypothetical protein
MEELRGDFDCGKERLVTLIHHDNTVRKATKAPTCSITSSVTITGTAAATATLTVATAAPTSALNRPLRLLLPSADGTAFAFFLLFGIPTHRKRWSKFLGLLILVSLAGLGCGVRSKIGGNSGNSGTTPGTYTVTVTVN